MKIPYIPEDAPFSEDQRSWLAGFLAGLHSRTAMGDASAGAATLEAPKDTAAPEKTVPTAPVDILYGTQTGNAEFVASEAMEVAQAEGLQANMHDMDAVDMDALAKMEKILFVVSTYGEGEMPDNAELFWDAVSGPTAPRMENTRFGVIALGDTGYDQFCQAGKLIDMRMEQLGATRIADRVDCDVDFEEPSHDWIVANVPLFKAEPESAPEPVAPEPEPVKVADKPAAKPVWNRKNPYSSTVVENRLMSGATSKKEIRHFAFSLGDSGLSYEVGDAMGIMPTNQQALVDGIIGRLGVKPDAMIDGHEVPLAGLLTSQYEIRTPSKNLITAIEELAGHDEFSHVVSNNDKEALDAFMWGRDALDLLNLNPDLAIDPAEFISWLKPLQHRAYSISSSPKKHVGEVHTTVAAVRWDREGREHMGVASTYLSDMCPQGALAPIFMSPNKNFRLPTDLSLPIIMVGPGTGIAPFRAFLEERRETGATGKNWLFFGDQHRASDFFYEDDIGEMSRVGLLTRLDLAFSRDQDEKVYVQHRMLENGKELFAWLDEGGTFYVCGDATYMAKDVDAALTQIIREEGGFSDDQTTAYISNLKREKRYLRDVY
ncbi:MAG: sulfite reductase flavoprotein subunit alpha [Pseudomonadota bacterium]